MLQRALILLAATVPSWAYPSGAPPGTCLTLLPRHDVRPQATPSPYRIEVNSRGNEVQSETGKRVIGDRFMLDPLKAYRDLTQMIPQLISSGMSRSEDS